MSKLSSLIIDCDALGWNEILDNINTPVSYRSEAYSLHNSIVDYEDKIGGVAYRRSGKWSILNMSPGLWKRISTECPLSGRIRVPWWYYLSHNLTHFHYPLQLEGILHNVIQAIFIDGREKIKDYKVWENGYLERYIDIADPARSAIDLAEDTYKIMEYRLQANQQKDINADSTDD